MSDTPPLPKQVSKSEIDQQISPEYRDQFLDILCRHLDVSVSILDKDLNYQFISDAAYKQLGITPKQLKVGDPLSHCHDLMMENGLLTQKILDKNKLSSEEQSKAEKTEKDVKRQLMTLGNGRTHHHVRKSLPNDFTISISEDVSDLVEKEKILERSLAIGNAGYWTYNFNTKQYQFSTSLVTYFGKEKIAMIRKYGILSIVEDDDKERYRTAIANLVKHGKKFDVMGRSKTVNGNVRWHHTTAELIRDAAGRPLQIWSFVQDKTRDKYQAEALEHAKDKAIAASKAKSEFLANMSHEIRTPMNGILGMAELLANTNIDERQKEFVEVINNSAAALLTIINDILDFSKIEAGALELDPIPFDLKTAINDVTSLLVAKAQEKNLELIINYPPDMPKHFIGDGGRLRQVLTNLIGNAIKFTSEGHIAINVDVSEPRDGTCFIRLDVADTGIGIPKEKLGHIFDKFTQADGSTTRVYGGTGLGLAITKSIVEMMGGRVSLTSELGVGSVFSVQVPLPIDENAVHHPLNSSSLFGKRALIVDDIKINRQIFTEQLRCWGVDTETAEDGVEGLAKLKTSLEENKPFDFVVLDYLMPGINGIEWAQMISQNSTIPNLPILMLSSCDPSISSVDMKKIGIVGHHVKPVREARLHKALQELTSMPKMAQPAPPSPQPPVAETQPPIEDKLETRIMPTPVPTRASPIASEQNSPQIEAKEPEQTAKTEILFAEDFPLNQEVVRLMLVESPYTPHFVNNGQEALNLYKADPARFPVIVMDVSMPVMDGYEASGQIIAYEKEMGLEHTPIIALTGHALKNDRQACIDAGMDDFLSKPVKQTELFDRIKFHLNQLNANPIAKAG
ncbi:signal transduction histidine kinase [Litorimonas taeanensis]|uniref:Sensory/regulatory protein RpfC n=1 Tax=Litorimonas taeanensis TaxID=568099 RepID=A0A420WD02_9PROT|nr:PAS domain-containing hybrid sensor histidine kinase/response regulator [Litorimonas taeanensis]RKQ68835.1 signal transduction histidine kinase [Litorimonas taeanensis]